MHCAVALPNFKPFQEDGMKWFQTKYDGILLNWWHQPKSNGESGVWRGKIMAVVRPLFNFFQVLTIFGKGLYHDIYDINADLGDG